MQEDLQPNEMRMQHKGDHRVPKVWSTNPSHFPRRQPRPSHLPRPRQKKERRRKKATPRDHDAGATDTPGTLFGEQGLSRGLPPTLRGLNPAWGRSETNGRPAVNSVSIPDMLGELVRLISH